MNLKSQLDGGCYVMDCAERGHWLAVDVPVVNCGNDVADGVERWDVLVCGDHVSDIAGEFNCEVVEPGVVIMLDES